MRKVRPVIGPFLLITLAIGVSQASAQRMKPPAAWTPEPVSLKGLGAAETLEKYTIRIPKGYKLQRPNNAPAGSRMWAWTGAPRSDESRGSLMMILLTFPPAQREQLSQPSLEQFVEKMVAAVKKQRTNWNQQKIENGVINGIRFARVRWEATDSRTQSPMRGFIYVARDGDTLVQFTSQDFEPETDNALPLAEASVLTFKKK